MSVNRSSELDTSLSRTDGVHRKYLNLSSSDRNKARFPDSADSELVFDEQSNVLGMKILNFEIPHTRYAIDKTTNNFYISEKWGEDEYYFYSFRSSTGGYSIQTLCTTLTLSTECPNMFNGDRGMGNDYNFTTSLLFGKVGIVSSGEYEYTVHASTETVTLSSITVSSDTEAILSYFAPSKQVFSPGALLVFQPYTYSDRDVQVVEILEDKADNKVRVLGDFSDVDWSTVNASLSKLVPYSADNSVSRILGYGQSDVHGGSFFEVLSIGSPFNGTDTLLNASVMVVTNFGPFLSAGDRVKLSGIPGFMNDMVCTVAVVHDETHTELYVNRSALWATRRSRGKIAKESQPSMEWEVGEITLSAVQNSSVELTLTTGSPATSLSTGDAIIFRGGFDSPEFAHLSARVVSVDGALVAVSFDYPASYLFSDGVSKLSPINADTLIPTTYISTDRFDLSRARRMVLCRAVVDNQDIGSIHIPSLSNAWFFGRIQLHSGADLVNFLNKDTAVGSHEFNSVLKRLNKIRFQFFNEDGTKYDFVGVDYTMFLEITCLDSNKGL